MPSISQISPVVVPRRRASASTMTSTWGRAPPLVPPLAPPTRSINASRRAASRDSPESDPAAFQRALVSASRMGATLAQATSSQRNSPRMPPCSSWCQRKWRLVWTRSSCSRSDSRERAARLHLFGPLGELLVAGLVLDQVEQVELGRPGPTQLAETHPWCRLLGFWS
jgi:hypothetical protein